MILLAHGYHLPLDPKENALNKPFPPLGTLVAAGLLRREELEFSFYDPAFCPDPATFTEALRGHRPARVALIADPHAIPQKQCTTRQRDAALSMIRQAKEYGKAQGRETEVFVAGPDATDHPDLYLQAGADHVAAGEHEPALLDWARGLPLPALIPRRPIIKDLDGLPAPAWDLVDLRAYADRWRRAHGLWELNFSTARGCPYRCNWCAKPTWGRGYQARSPGSVVQELRDIQARYAPDRFWFTDDIFAVRPGWLREFRRILAATPGPPLRFRCQHRADLLQDPATVADLAASGCVEVWLGAESGSDRVLKAMDKDGTVEEIRTASRLLRQAGVRRGLFLQLGYPGERPEDVAATVRMVRELRPEEIGVSVSYPLPGTVFYERTKHRLQDANWSESMENRLLFRSDLPQSFYDHARALLRAEHALLSFPAGIPPEAAPRQILRRAAALPLHAARWPAHRLALAVAARSAALRHRAPDPPAPAPTGPAAPGDPPIPPAA